MKNKHQVKRGENRLESGWETHSPMATLTMRRVPKKGGV